MRQRGCGVQASHATRLAFLSDRRRDDVWVSACGGKVTCTVGEVGAFVADATAMSDELAIKAGGVRVHARAGAVVGG